MDDRELSRFLKQILITSSPGKAHLILSELERIGLIERKKQGQGKPDRIYVLQFCTQSGLLDFPKGNF